MKRNLVKNVLQIGSLVVLLIVMGCSSPLISSEQQVRDNVSKYLTALETKDIGAMVALTDDTRFPDKEEQKKQYKSINDEIKGTSIKEIKKISETEYKTTVSFTASGKTEEISFPVMNKSNKWMIIVGQEIK